MEKFGAVKYAVLCKSIHHVKPDLEGDKKDTNPSMPANKGTGFV